MEGSFGEGLEFDGVEGTFAEGVTFELADFELQPSTAYTLAITSVKVDGTELAPEGGYALNFKTRGAERKMSWTFTIDAESAAQIVADAAANTTEDPEHYIDILKNGATTHRYYVPARNYEEIMLPDGTALPMTEDLTFKFGNKVFYVGDTEGSYKDLIAFNGKNQYMVIPDCQEGDIIIFNANRATKGTADKQTCIQAMNGAAIAPDGLESSNGIKDSIWLGSSYTNFKFEVLAAGDVTFRFSNCLMKSINIEEKQEKLPRYYSVLAMYKEGDEAIILKELVSRTSGITGSTVKTNYPYWLADNDGKVYTHGSKGSEFMEQFDLKNGVGDTIFVINYAKTDIEGVVYLSEGEDIEGAVACTSPNATVRSSMGKSGYVTEDTKLVTLKEGTYKIKAIIFDADKTPSYVVTLSKGEGEENDIYLSATATNWTEAESDLLTITEPTDITLKAGGSDTHGLDVIMIYASEDAPEEPDEFRNYSVIAAYTAADGTQKVLKELVPTTEGKVGETINVNYSYWLADSEGVLYTKGATSKQYIAPFTLESGEGDVQFVIEYTKEGTENVAFVSEGEEIEGAVACTSGNAAIRSSKGAAAYFTADTKVTTLQPGYYMVKAILFDEAKSPESVCTLSYDGKEISFQATKTNWTAVATEYTLNITEATDLNVKAGGNEKAGLDIIAVYAVDAPVNRFGDLNGDGIVNALDIQIVINEAVKENNQNLNCDLTDDGTVNALDIQTVINLASGVETKVE
jgi:hypothetical protein